MAATGTDCLVFDTHEAQRIVGAAEIAVAHIVAQLHDPKRQGGYFCLVAQDGNPMAAQSLIVGVGTVLMEKWKRYSILAPEKARRLMRHPEHVSSAQSRSPDNDEWGGAIVADPYILSFSGLSPDTADEAAMLLTAMGLGLLTEAQAADIAALSDNQIFHQALAACQWGKPTEVNY